MKKFTTEEFIEKANHKHNNFFIYDKVVYTGKRNKIIIICPIHGEFKQIAGNHLYGYSCPKCANNKTAKKNSFTTKEFIVKMHKHFPNYKLISPYKNKRNKVIIEDELNIKYNVHPSSIISNNKPSIQSALNPTEAYIKLANLKHSNKYIYAKTSYTKMLNKIIITCPIHGDFSQLASNHIAGRGCPKCNFAHPGYKKSNWTLICTTKKDASPRVYIIKCYNFNETFIKIGITHKSVFNRFPSKSHLPYSYEIIKEIKGSSDFVWDKEKELHRKFKSYKYKPKLPFGGDTECFKLTILQSDIFN